MAYRPVAEPRDRMGATTLVVAGLLALGAGLAVPVGLLAVTWAQDEDSLPTTRESVVLEGVALTSRPFAHANSSRYAGTEPPVWTFEVRRVIDAHGQDAPAAGSRIEVVVEDYDPGADEFHDGPRALTIGVHAAEQHDVDDGVVYWRGWSLTDARAGPLWTPQERHLALVPGLALLGVAAGALFAFGLVRPGEASGVPLAGAVVGLVAGVSLAALAVGFAGGFDGSPFGADNDEGVGAEWPMFLVAAAGIAAAVPLPRLWRRGPAFALSIAALAMVPLSLVLHAQEGLADQTWSSSWRVLAVLLVIGWAVAWPRAPWHRNACIAVAVAAALFAAWTTSGIAIYVGFTGALGVWGPLALLCVLLVASAVATRRVPSGPGQSRS